MNQPEPTPDHRLCELRAGAAYSTQHRPARSRRDRSAWAVLVVGAAALVFTMQRPSHGETEKDIAFLEKQLDQARIDMEGAEKALEETYLHMEADYERVSADLEAAVAGIGAAIRDDAERIRLALLEGPSGRPPSKGAQLLIARDHLAESIAATPMDAGFRAPLGALLAEPLTTTLLGIDLEDLDARIQQALVPVFRTDVEFAQTWNDHLFERVPEAADFARTRARYLDIGQRLEVARSPQRFDDAGQRLPPGMLQVKKGTYAMGPQSGWKAKGMDKKTRKVTLPSYYIDKNEVTNAEYMVFWKELTPELQQSYQPKFWALKEGSYTFPEGKDDHPVVGVSFNAAYSYAAWAGKRLPTEDEWEAAARGPKGLKFPWGDDYESGRANDRDTGLADTAPVGSFPAGASSIGCLDLAGNVEEWTATGESGDLIEGLQDSNQVLIVARGGNYNAAADGVSGTFRWVYPGMATRNEQLGFRCAMDIPKRKR